jgi:hypothetical protein
MKIFKMMALAAVVLFAVACNGKNPDEPKVGGFENIENEWKLVSVDGVANDFSVYIKFESGVFVLYQQIYSWDYVAYSGEYSIDNGVLSGYYFDDGDWKTSYTGGVSDDGTLLTLKSKDSTPVTYVYEACTIPESIVEETTRATSVEVVPFL